MKRGYLSSLNRNKQKKRFGVRVGEREGHKKIGGNGLMGITIPFPFGEGEWGEGVLVCFVCNDLTFSNGVSIDLRSE